MERTVAVVGASVAGVRVAEALRRGGFDDRVILLDRERRLPYDKPPLSKDLLLDVDAATPPLITEAALSERGIEFRAGAHVVGVDVAGQRLELAGAAPVAFTDLVIATGTRPRRLDAFEGVDGVSYLRTADDARLLARRLHAGPSAVVVIGGGFIGAEVASAARTLGLDVTLLEAGSQLMGRVLPTVIADEIAELHRSHGVRIRCGVTVTGPVGQDRIRGVRLLDGEVVPADVVVIGIGAVANTDWLATSDLPIDDGVACEPDLRVRGMPNVYAVGDVARWCNPRYGRSMRLEHWSSARSQATAVARSILGRGTAAFSVVPYVWSDQHGITIQHVGEFDATHVEVEATTTAGGGRVFSVFDGDHLVGATAVDAPFEFGLLRRTLVTAPHPELAHETRGPAT